MVTPRPVRTLVDELVGKQAGSRTVYEQLRRDPCAKQLGAYRLSGPLAPIVCGVHLKRDFRLAFTIQPPDDPEGPTRVVILYVGQREPRHTESDVWTVLHDLFGVENPPADPLRPPCCDDGLPEVSQPELDAFLDELQRMTRGRRVRSPSIFARRDEDHRSDLCLQRGSWWRGSSGDRGSCPRCTRPSASKTGTKRVPKQANLTSRNRTQFHEIPANQ